MPVLSKRLPDDLGFTSAEALAQVGPWISIDLARPDSHEPDQTVFGPAHRVHALIDTGADFNVVTNAYAHQLGARPVDFIESYSVHGVAAKPVPVYLLCYRVPELDEMRIEQFVGTELPPNLPVLFGRMFLSGKILIYDGVLGNLTVAA